MEEGIPTIPHPTTILLDSLLHWNTVRTHGFFLETLGFLTGPEKYQIIGYHDY